MGVRVDGSGNVYFADYACATVSKISPSGTITIVAGTGIEGSGGDGGPATSARLDYPQDVAIDSSGNLYIADSGNNVVRMVSTSGTISTVAGNGSWGYSGDNGPATSAELAGPSGVAVDSQGNVYIADFYNKIIRKVVLSTGTITTVAGTPGTGGYSGDGGLATSAQINGAQFVAVDSAGNLYFPDIYDNVVREVNVSTGNISTVAGNGGQGYTGDGNAATSAELNAPKQVRVDSTGNIYIADTGNNVIRMVTVASGKISTIAGTGTAGYSGDGGAATSAQLNGPQGIALDTSNNIYVSDTSNFRLRVVGSLVAGGGGGGSPTTPTLSLTSSANPANYGQPISFTATISSGPTGTITFYDGSTAIGAAGISGNIATLSISTLGLGTHSITAYWSGNSSYNAVTSSALSQVVNTAGVTLAVSSSANPAPWSSSVTFTATISSGPTGLITFYDGTTSLGTGLIEGTTATLTTSSLAVGSHSITAAWAGNADYGVATSSALSQTVSKLNPTLVVASSQSPSTSGQAVTFTATISNGLTGTITFYDNGAAIGSPATINGATATLTASSLPAGAQTITAIWPGSATYNAVTSTAITQTVGSSGSSGGGNINLWAGVGTQGCVGNGIAATSAKLSQPMGIRVDGSGNVYFADYACATVSKISPSGTITIVAGTGIEGSGGDGGPATSARLDYPQDVAIDPSGNLYIADSGNNVVRMVSTSGTISTVAGNGSWGYSGDNGPATSAELAGPSGVAIDSQGNLYIADLNNKIIRKVVLSTGTITTVAGTPGTGGDSGDGGKATSAQINGAQFVAVDSAGNLYFPDLYDNVVREVNVSTGNISTVVGTSAGLKGPEQVAVDTNGHLYVADTGNNLIRIVTLATGSVSTFAGTGTSGYSGDGGTATSAELNGPQGLALDSLGNVYIADTSNFRLRQVGSTAAANPTITWNAPAPIPYGTALSGTQLDATASVAGTFTYTPSAGTVLPAGTSTLSVTFAPSVNGYNSVTARVPITVNKGTPAITWSTPSAISYGTPLSSTQLDATSSVAGTPTYSPSFHAVPAVGTDTLSVTYVPNDTADYNSATATVNLTVTPQVPQITLTSSADPSTYGEPVTFTPTWPSGATGAVSIYDGSTLLGNTVQYPMLYSGRLALNPATRLLYVLSTDYFPIPITEEINALTVFNVDSALPVGSIGLGNPYPLVFNNNQQINSVNTVAVNPTTNMVYLCGDQSVLAISGASDSASAAIPLACKSMSINQSTNTLYIQEPSGSLDIVDGANNSTMETITGLGEPTEGRTVAVNPTGSMVYVGYYVGSGPSMTGYLTLIDTTTNTINKTISLGAYVCGMDVNTTTDKLYAAYASANNQLQFSCDSIAVVNGSTGDVIATISTLNPDGSARMTFGNIAVDSQTDMIYGALFEPAGGVVAINGADNTVASMFGLVAHALSWDVVVDQSSNKIWYSDVDGTIAFLNGATGVVTDNIDASNSYTTSTLAVGTHPITAQYSGDANWAAATSNVVNQVVELVTPSLAFAAHLPFYSYGASFTVNATSDSPAPITYSVLFGPATIAGSTVTTTGVGTLTLQASQAATSVYAAATANETVQVNPLTPVISWATPAAIPSGTPLSGTQLDASISSPAGLAGTFTYNPPVGTVPPVGTDILSVTFVPSSSSYGPVSKSVPLTVTAGPAYDTGTVTLTVNGTTAATATYGQNSTPATVAAGLASGVTANSLVTVEAAGSTISLQAKTNGSTTNYTYSLTASSTNGFSMPSFLGTPGSGALEGGADQNTTGSTVHQYSITGYQANGNLQNYTDSVMGTWTFSYDDLDRLAGAQGSQPGNSFTNYCWSYDSFGNRLQQEMATTAFNSGSGGGSPCLPYNPQPLTYNANNQISGGPSGAPGYDAAGDIVTDPYATTGTNQYLYDADGRVCAVESPTADGVNVMTGYVYDAEGQRVAKGTITSWSCDPSTNGFSASVNETDFILDQAGRQLTEMTSQGGTMTWAHTNVWAGSQLVATYSAITDANGQADSQLHFYLDDWLGTRRAQTDYAGVLERTCSSLPFGDQESCTPTPTENLFTGKERDAESGNDYFGARYYASTMGRFLSPDWSAQEEPVPYAKLDDPQTLNLYQYMRNNPLGGVDPDGHQEGFVITPEGPVPLAFPISGQLTREDYNRMGNQVANFFAPLPGILKNDLTHPIQSLKDAFNATFSSSNSSGQPKDVYIDPNKYPASAGHVADAQAAGKPDVLTVHRPGADANRAAGGSATQAGYDKDEYPPAVTKEGGEGASRRDIPSSDNRGSGASLGNQIRDVPDGGKIRVIPQPKPKVDPQG